MVYLDAISQHDVLVLAVVCLLLPDVLRLLQDPALPGPVPGLAVLLDVVSEGQPGAEEGGEEPAQGEDLRGEGRAAAGLGAGHGEVSVNSYLTLQVNIYLRGTLFQIISGMGRM